MLEESEEPQLSSNSDSESQQDKENNEKNSKNSVEILEESKVIRKAKDRVLPGFETSRDKSKWKSSFFFVQAADTQLGMIDTWGGKDTGKSMSEALLFHQLTHNLTKDCPLNYQFST